MKTNSFCLHNRGFAYVDRFSSLVRAYVDDSQEDCFVPLTKYHLAVKENNLASMKA